MIDSSTSPRMLANLLGTQYSRLMYVVYGKGVNNLYETFEIPKKNGGVRTIRAPNPQLKILQKRLKIFLEKLYEPHPAASAFIAGRGIVYNAKKHVKKAVVFNVDLEGFYDQIHFGRVRGLLVSRPYSLQQETAQLIAHICCVDKVLPQGAPTSPVLSNMICRRLDRGLSLLAKKNEAYYSRYADDITFSFRKIVANDICYMINDAIKPSRQLNEVIAENGFSVNEGKTRLQIYSERQVVTGLKVNKKVNLDRRYIRTTRAMIYSLSQGVEAANVKYAEIHGGEAGKVENVVFGRLNFIGMVKGKESTVFQTLAKKFNNLNLDIKARTEPPIRNVKLENDLHFRSYENRSQLEKSVWVVSFDGMDELCLDGQLVQGTAFMLKGQRLLTAAHTFAKASANSDDVDTCILYRIKEPEKKYKAKVVSTCKYSDIAELEFLDEDIPKFNCLELASSDRVHSGYQLAIIGFPQLQPGHNSVTIIPCIVTNTFILSTFKYGEVNVPIAGGNSGGPVVNAYMQVIGMAVRGVDVTFDGGNAALEGTNAFIYAPHFPRVEKSNLC